ncbi:MAG: lipopolysaccharide biosynthesis protein [Chloroflexota bacterium]
MTTLAAAGAKFVSVLTMLVSVPLTLNYLGVERYGMWMTISSVIAMLAFADLGIGNGLLNAVAEANGKDDREAARRYVSSAFFLLGGLALLLTVSFAITYPLLPWPRLFNVSSPLAAVEAGPAMAVFVACFLVNLPLGVVQRVQLGYQEGFANSLWAAFGSLLGLAATLLVIALQGGLPWLVLAFSGGPVLATLLNAWVLFGRRRAWLRPSLEVANRSAGLQVLRIGLLFFVLQVAVALAYSSDNLIAAWVIGLDAVAQYSVPTRMFAVVTMVVALPLSPLWPAYGEAIARGDAGWVRNTLLRSTGMAALMAGFPVLLLVVFGARIVDLWVGPGLTPSLLLLTGLGVWTVIAGVGNALAMFLNGANIIRFQVVSATLMACAAIVLKITLAQNMGVAGIVWGTVAAYTAFTAIPLAVYLPRILQSFQLTKNS